MSKKHKKEFKFNCKKVYCKKCDKELTYTQNDEMCQPTMENDNICVIKYINCPRCKNKLQVQRHYLYKNNT